MQQGENDVGLIEDESLRHMNPDQKDAEKPNTAHAVRSEGGVDPPELGEACEFQQPPKNPLGFPVVSREDRVFAHGYRPSMLATTVEHSASGLIVQSTQALRELGLKAQQPNSETGGGDITNTTSIKPINTPEPAVCAACRFTRNSMGAETDPGSTSWISCDGCKSWFHFACADFKNEREVRAVDKYRCRKCKAIYGPTTYVRKSARAHTAIDYAGLNQGLVKTSDERPEHHYIQPIKDGTINLQPENFARMRPELVTAEHFEKGNGMKEPIVIPAEYNPRPRPAGSSESCADNRSEDLYPNEGDATTVDDWFARDPESQNVPDHGQDALDMVVPPNLTVRKVAELYGPEEKVEVIDVKSQNGEGKKWNMRRWADYYENTSNKVVRNVISLEVSQSTLGRLIRRPQIVRDLDLQDSVWPAELQAKGEFPRVQFYCLMSVADCFTDFHIDFGGSSVFYHILKGKKTFFFIPPKEKHLKKYEDWCMSPAQNWTFLGDQTKECYRVDLSEGDTMLIPAGWIHAVWTPEDSLVIGGNFLTRLNYSMQLRIAQIEKATGVARKFRYPHFQKIQWFTAIRYLERDPLPSIVRSALEAGQLFHRQYPAYHGFDSWGENSISGPENYHARYYSQPELEGLPDLIRYLLRTALIDSGEITEGITIEIRNAVKKSIPRGFGEPLEIVKEFAIWCAWKRGNELIPHWAYPDTLPKTSTPELVAKLGAAAAKKLDGRTAQQAPHRQSSRNQIQQPSDFYKEKEPNMELWSGDNDLQSAYQGPSQPSHPKPLPVVSSPPYKISLVDGANDQQPETPKLTDVKKRKPASGSGAGSHRKTACDSCRKRRRACKHKTDPKAQVLANSHSTPSTLDRPQGSLIPFLSMQRVSSENYIGQPDQHKPTSDDADMDLGPHEQSLVGIGETESTGKIRPIADIAKEHGATETAIREPIGDIKHDTTVQVAHRQQRTPAAPHRSSHNSSMMPHARGRSKACNYCRKSKVSYVFCWL